jgi:heptosyltransferase-2
VVEPESVPLLQNNSRIHRILTPGLDTLTRLLVERFDLLLCLDKAGRATALAMQVKATRKAGFGMTEYGTLGVLNPEAEYALLLGLSDELKFRRNRKSHQQILFEAVGMEFGGEEYILELDDDAIAWALDVGREALGREDTTCGPWPERSELNAPSPTARAQRPVVGLNTGAGPTFAGKAWPVQHAAQLAARLHAELGCSVLLLGGERERERNEEIARVAGEAIIDTGCHSLLRFAALVDLCDVVVSGDTLGMHVAIARRKQVVALFGSTCAQEIELYGRGERIVTDVECAPCYLRTCTVGEICMERIPVEQVLAAVRRRLEQASGFPEARCVPS